MVQKTQRNPKRNEQEWLDLIQECRSSGLSDKDWCDLHHIHRSNLYYHIRKLRAQACSIPDSCFPAIPGMQAVVPIPVHTSGSLGFHESPEQKAWDCTNETAIRIHFHGFQVEITNTAAGETITHTIAALQRLC